MDLGKGREWERKEENKTQEWIDDDAVVVGWISLNLSDSKKRSKKIEKIFAS